MCVCVYVYVYIYIAYIYIAYIYIYIYIYIHMYIYISKQTQYIIYCLVARWPPLMQNHGYATCCHCAELISILYTTLSCFSYIINIPI